MVSVEAQQSLLKVLFRPWCNRFEIQGQHAGTIFTCQMIKWYNILRLPTFTVCLCVDDKVQEGRTSVKYICMYYSAETGSNCIELACSMCTAAPGRVMLQVMLQWNQTDTDCNLCCVHCSTWQDSVMMTATLLSQTTDSMLRTQFLLFYFPK